MGEQVAARIYKKDKEDTNQLPYLSEKAEPLPRKQFIIDTGKDEQLLITANPISRAVLL